MGKQSTRSERIMNELKVKEYSYGDVARALGISPTSVYKWIRKEGQITPEHMDKLARFLGTTPEWIQFGTTSVEGVEASTSRVIQALQMLDDKDRLAVEEMLITYVTVKSKAKR